MFDQLSDRLQATLSDVRSRGKLSESDVDAAMREIVGVLRGGEVALVPAPSVAHLDALLARRSHADARLVVSGDPRALPASVELSAYRVVEHLLGVLADELRRDVNDLDFDVGLHVVFADQAAHDAYQVTPEHLRFIDENNKYGRKTMDKFRNRERGQKIEVVGAKLRAMMPFLNPVVISK